MSCLGPFYKPLPPREWSRVQNQCTYFTGEPPTTLNIPLIGITVPFTAAFYYADLLRKGNVLQYKKNSSNLTKSQRYSKIATGTWTNRNTTWATQSDKYSNPNTKSLKRVGNINILLDGSQTQTTLPVTCPAIININNPSLPIIITNSNIINNDLPIIIEDISNINIIPIVDPIVVTPTIVIPDEGNLLCNTVENICTGETTTQKANKFFNPTSDSDVPGRIRQLYWNPRIQTWYPRQNLTNNNSTNKWPYNSKFIFPVNGFIKPK